MVRMWFWMNVICVYKYYSLNYYTLFTIWMNFSPLLCLLCMCSLGVQTIRYLSSLRCTSCCYRSSVLVELLWYVTSGNKLFSLWYYLMYLLIYSNYWTIFGFDDLLRLWMSYFCLISLFGLYFWLNEIKLRLLGLWSDILLG